jgi:predicted O-methyltransferase YrrM
MSSKFKELMQQLGTEDVKVNAPQGQPQGVPVTVENKKKLDDRYTFNQGWYDALLNTEAIVNEREELEIFRLDPPKKRQIVEIGVYEGASSCFWSDFYLDHPESRLISIDPFTGSEEHHENPQNYPELENIELTARGNIAKSKNAAKVSILKGFSQFVYKDLILENGDLPWIDLLYIDGAHDSTSVARDVCMYVPLVKPGGVVIFDDYAHPDVRRAVDMALNAFATAEKAAFTGWQLIVKF